MTLCETLRSLSLLIGIYPPDQFLLLLSCIEWFHRPHVAGCAALWAQTSGLRGQLLWNQLITSAHNIVTGRVAAEQVKALATVPGISVAFDETVTISLPDSDIQ